MWKAYANAVNDTMPQADIVHDRFHISQHLNNAVDTVRRQENKVLVDQGDHRLKGTKFQWLCNEENLKDTVIDNFTTLRDKNIVSHQICCNFIVRKSEVKRSMVNWTSTRCHTNTIAI